MGPADAVDAGLAVGAVRRLSLRSLAAGDEVRLTEIHATPEVSRWWGMPDPRFPWDAIEVRRLVIEVEDRIAGLIQYEEELDPQYRYASIDLFVDPALHGRGGGTEAVRRIVDHLVSERGHHRITIDPAAENRAAIRAYEKAGFRAVGVMSRYERDPDGHGWRDGLLMEYVTSPL